MIRPLLCRMFWRKVPCRLAMRKCLIHPYPKTRPLACAVAVEMDALPKATDGLPVDSVDWGVVFFVAQDSAAQRFLIGALGRL